METQKTDSGNAKDYRKRGFESTNENSTSAADFKRQKRHGEDVSDFQQPQRVLSSIRLKRRDYGVGWVCALHYEMAAAELMLDAIHRDIAPSRDDSNAYILGSIGGHNIAIACLPHKGPGTSNAAIVGSNMLRSFPLIKFMLLVGIGGGVPGQHDLRLGDVVVSNEVVQYDLGKATQGGRFQRTGISYYPPAHIRTALSKLRARHESQDNEIPFYLQQMLERYPNMTQYANPGLTPDLLFNSDCEHVSTNGCDSCDTSKLENRPPRPDQKPRIHYGKIASGNRVIKDASERERLSRELDVLCCEMEAAGLMESFPCLVVRGISDYSDAHKNDGWQRYAAGTAAAFAKALLFIMPSRAVYTELAPQRPSLEPAPLHNSDRGGGHGRRSAPVQPFGTLTVSVSGIKAGDRANQVVTALPNGAIVARDFVAGDGSFQFFGPEETLRHITKVGAPQTIEDPDEDSTSGASEEVEECISGTAYR